MMKEYLDLTDPSNGPLEFAIMRCCIGFQIIKWNSEETSFPQTFLDLCQGETMLYLMLKNAKE